MRGPDRDELEHGGKFRMTMLKAWSYLFLEYHSDGLIENQVNSKCYWQNRLQADIVL